jgi:hypothetical protein
MWCLAALNACARGERVPSLYQPELQRHLSRAERWRLDTELFNEISMKDHNSRRFEIPEPFEKRALWVESMARWYLTADLIQQLVDFRRSRMRDNETAFQQLVDFGEKGDIGAKCLSAAIYRHFPVEVRRRWKYTFEQLAAEAVKARSSGHAICVAVEAELLLQGDRAKAKSLLIESAVAGLYGYQKLLSRMHLDGSTRFRTRDVALKLCWQRVAFEQSAVAGFDNTCEVYRLGIASDAEGKEVPLPAATQKLAAEWCAPAKKVIADDCARMERDFDIGDGK